MSALGNTTRDMISQNRHEKITSCIVAWQTETGEVRIAQSSEMSPSESFRAIVCQRLAKGKK